MPYIKCPTCRRLLGNKYIIVRNENKIIDNDIGLSLEEKRNRRTDVINSLGLTRICCKARVMGAIYTEEYLK